MSKSCGCKKFNGGGMAKSDKEFKGKETYGEEMKEAKGVKSGRTSPAGFARKEKSEGNDEGGARKMGEQIKSGAMSPKQYASKESSESESEANPMAKPAASVATPPAETTKPAAPAAAAPAKPAGVSYLKKGGKVKCMARGGGIEVRGKTKGRFV